MTPLILINSPGGAWLNGFSRKKNPHIEYNVHICPVLDILEKTNAWKAQRMNLL